MSFKKSKDKMIFFFEMIMEVWHWKILALHNLELEGNYLCNA